MSSEIILYDLASRGPKPKCWSLNPWKARMSLNYKGLPYQTEWTEYPDIAPKFQSYGIEKNDGKSAYTDYSCPAVKLPDGRYVMDSRKIGEALDELQSARSLHMDSAYVDRTLGVVTELFNALRPIAMVRIPERVLNPRSAEYFEETRAKRLGMPLAELAKSDQAGEGAWRKAEPKMRELAEILKENQEGPYVLGKEVSFADFIIAGCWACLKVVDQDGDLFDRGMGFDSSFREQFDACQEWMQKDD